jgi:CubicO group peptidase (beta-lactamase class C family)
MFLKAPASSPPTAIRENYVYGDGQVNSTGQDMAKWDQSLYTERLVKASTLREAFAPGQLSDGTQVNYGFGWDSAGFTA